MKRSKFTGAQIFSILKDGESGIPVADLTRTHGLSEATPYNWRAKHGGMDASMMKRMKELEEENRRLKKDVCRGKTKG
jgi:putative transposase